jgi:hypothetical protein
MDIEFHYYMTYLIAARAGFAPAEAAIIAQSAQGVDDNHIPVEVGGGSLAPYRNTVSQTMDIMRPHHDLRIYPIFHFIPGNPDAPSAKRKDGVKNLWVTTPNSPIANEMLDTALASGDLYRIGASAHAYCDTWAHQNFVGKEDDINIVPYEVSGLIRKMTREAYDVALKIGHALAEHMPDRPGLIWGDKRLDDEIATVNNKERFLDAAGNLFGKLYLHKHGAAPDSEWLPQAADLKADLAADIGAHDAINEMREKRIESYQKRALSPSYGGAAMPEYDVGLWSNAAFLEDHESLIVWLEDAVAGKLGDYGDFLREVHRARCTSRNPTQFKNADWYKFQEAVKAHLDECWAILVKHIPGLEGAT